MPSIDYLESFGMDAIEAHEEELVSYVLPKMLEIPHVHVLGSQNPREKHGVIAFTIDDVHPHDVATILDSKGYLCTLWTSLCTTFGGILSRSSIYTPQHVFIHA